MMKVKVPKDVIVRARTNYLTVLKFYVAPTNVIEPYLWKNMGMLLGLPKSYSYFDNGIVPEEVAARIHALAGPYYKTMLRLYVLSYKLETPEDTRLHKTWCELLGINQ